MKRLILTFIFALLLSFGAFAAESDDSRAVIGADLTDEQIDYVYSVFGVERGEVTELTVTNSDERKYLEDLVDESVIGTYSISCAYIELADEGEGLTVTTHNINWCSEEMYISALATAGITDAEIIVAAPFEVSGTAALTGVYLAYEDLTGEALDEAAKQVGTEELTVTASLADELGSAESVEIVNELKLLLDTTRDMTDTELAEEIQSIASGIGVTLTDTQVNQLISLCRSLEGLNADALVEKVESVQSTIKNLGDAAEKAGSFIEKLKDAFNTVVNFFKDLASIFGN